MLLEEGWRSLLTEVLNIMLSVPSNREAMRKAPRAPPGQREQIFAAAQDEFHVVMSRRAMLADFKTSPESTPLWDWSGQRIDINSLSSSAQPAETAVQCGNMGLCSYHLG